MRKVTAKRIWWDLPQDGCTSRDFVYKYLWIIARPIESIFLNWRIVLKANTSNKVCAAYYIILVFVSYKVGHTQNTHKHISCVVSNLQRYIKDIAQRSSNIPVKERDSHCLFPSLIACSRDILYAHTLKIVSVRDSMPIESRSRSLNKL